MIDTKDINRILNIEDSYKAPQKIMEILFDKDKREDVFKQFIEIEPNLDQDCFFRYFQDEHAERKKYAQDFTPPSIGTLLAKMLSKDDNGTTFDVASGTGGLLIKQWVADRNNSNILDYKPGNYYYSAEELSDRAIPFLLFNLMIRGMNATVSHIDVLTREAQQVYFIFNEKDDYLSFSSLNVMPRSETVERQFDIRSWKGEAIKHIETANPLIMGDENGSD